MTAACSVFVEGPPKLSEITFAPCECAHAMHAATSDVSPEPSAPSALQMISGESNATPAMPAPLPATAPIVPATCVPWPSSSVQLPSLIDPF